MPITRSLIFSNNKRGQGNVFPIDAAGFVPRGFFCACSCRGAFRAGLRGRRRSVVLRDAGSIPPGLPGVFVVTGSPAGCATGIGGAAQAMPCVPPVLLALVGQSGISSRIGCSSGNPSFTEAVVRAKRSARASG